MGSGSLSGNEQILTFMVKAEIQHHEITLKNFFQSIVVIF